MERVLERKRPAKLRFFLFDLENVEGEGDEGGITLFGLVFEGDEPIAAECGVVGVGSGTTANA